MPKSSERPEPAGTSRSAPRFKRRRLDASGAENWELEDTFTQCLSEQVFPHLDRARYQLPSYVDSKRVGKKVLALLTGPGSSFNEEYKRGNGRLSQEFERQLAARAFRECALYAKLPEYQTTPTVPSSVPMPQPWATLDHAIINTPTAQPRPKPPTGKLSNGFLSSTSKIPLPATTGRSKPKPTATRVSTGPVISSSPSPLPTLPQRSNNTPSSRALNTPGPVSKTTGFSSSAGQPLKSTGQASQPIVIDSDDEDDVPTKINGVKSAASPKKPSPVPPPKQESLKLPSKATPPPRPVKKTLPLFETQRRLTPAPIPEAIVPSAEVEHRYSPPDVFKSTDEYYALWSKAYGVGASRNPSDWFSSQDRPYLTFKRREAILQGTTLYHPDSSLPAAPFHVDFSAEEMGMIYAAFRQSAGQPPKERLCGLADLRSIMKPRPDPDPIIAPLLESMPRRTKASIKAFLLDVFKRQTSAYPASLSLRQGAPERADYTRNSHTHSLLFRREISGYRGYRGMRERINFHDEFRKCREDDLEVRSEWTDCAGDIATIAWVSNDSFICGTTEHSDSHNQQYNKPGNLVLGSCQLGTLRAYPQHRIVRPIVAKGENSTEEMRESQDPWLYSSVVSSGYDAAHNRAFTSGFDRSVKVWRVDSGSSMEMIGEWKHGGNVNFVAASKDGSGMVATASDVAVDAVRIYSVQNGVPVSASPYRSYSCSRVTDAEGNTVSTEKWAYFPATMQWGLAEGVKHLLLVGYSPRSRTGDDHDIPEDRLTTGELCLWDGRTGERWKVTSATTSNVFEVLWHPSQQCFIAATTPIGPEKIDSGIRTQIRVFWVSDNPEYGGKAFTPLKTLDCRAADINELTIMPNSYSYCYVTAGCTDGATYIWDTALGDEPIHLLRHDKPIEEFSGDREREDVGVKFTAWGTTLDRFYTGSSDGAVKVWNVRSLKRPFVRDLVHVPSAVSCAMFSPDRSKLVVGDATGRVFLLSLDADDVKPTPTTTIRLPGTNHTRTIRCPTAIIPHPEPPPPSHDAAGRPYDPQTGRSRADAYLAARQLVRHPSPTVGAVKGPRYADTGLFWKQGHLHEDPAQPLLATWEVLQQESIKVHRGGGGGGRMRFLKPPREDEALAARHEMNARLDLDVEGLEEETRRALEREGAELQVEGGEEYGFLYEEEWDGEEW